MSLSLCIQITFIPYFTCLPKTEELIESNNLNIDYNHNLYNGYMDALLCHIYPIFKPNVFRYYKSNYKKRYLMISIYSKKEIDIIDTNLFTVVKALYI